MYNNDWHLILFRYQNRRKGILNVEDFDEMHYTWDVPRAHPINSERLNRVAQRELYYNTNYGLGVLLESIPYEPHQPVDRQFPFIHRMDGERQGRDEHLTFFLRSHHSFNEERVMALAKYILNSPDEPGYQEVDAVAMLDCGQFIVDMEENKDAEKGSIFLSHTYGLEFDYDNPSAEPTPLSELWCRPVSSNLVQAYYSGFALFNNEVSVSRSKSLISLAPLALPSLQPFLTHNHGHIGTENQLRQHASIYLIRARHLFEQQHEPACGIV